MLRRAAPRRGAFTLVELLVAISIIVVLTALAVLVIPDIMDQDRSTDGANLTRQWLMIAKARAARDQQPRGLRLIGRPNNIATEAQYTEAPLLIPNRNGGWNNGTPDNHPYVTVRYYVWPDNPPGWPAPTPTPTPGTLIARRVTIGNILGFEADIAPGSILALEGWGFFMRLPPNYDIDPHTNSNGTIAFYIRHTGQIPAGQYDVSTYNQITAMLDPHMGGSTQKTTYLFGVYAYPRPLVGETIQQLPKNIGIDLGSSQPAGIAGADYDIVFAPNGQLMFRSEGQINLWVRDFTKNGGSGGNFATGGEQQAVSLKKSGALGVFPIAQGGDPFQFARRGASAPSQ